MWKGSGNPKTQGFGWSPVRARKEVFFFPDATSFLVGFFFLCLSLKHGIVLPFRVRLVVKLGVRKKFPPKSYRHRLYGRFAFLCRMGYSPFPKVF